MEEASSLNPVNGIRISLTLEEKRKAGNKKIFGNQGLNSESFVETAGIEPTSLCY